MGMNSKNWCEFHRINFDCDEWCPQCQEQLIRGLTEKCLTLLAPHLTGMLNISVIIQNATPSSLLTDTKTTKTDHPVTQLASTETEKTKNQNSVPTAESEGSEMYWAEPPTSCERFESERNMEISGCMICQGSPKAWCPTHGNGSPAPDEWNNEYPHLTICNGNRRYPAGVRGHGCCCLNVSTEYMYSEARKMNADATPPEHIKTAHHLIKKTLKNGWSWGILWRWKSLWVGGHYSYKEKRYCVNLIPCLTFWFTKPGGAVPYVA